MKAIDMNVAKKMRRVIPREILALLKRIGALADKNGSAAFVVGGPVRDLLLGVKNIDIDIVLEDNAIAFGALLARALNGKLTAHRRFQTASLTIKWPGGRRARMRDLKIDLATARKERYVRPAALPAVRRGSLKDDLSRRDFTINAMAVCLNGRNFGHLVDFFGGARDVRRGTVKVMHDGSFIDDPTRIFRAVRFEQRFGFSIEAHTERLIRRAIKDEMFKRTGNERIRRELILMLKEEAAGKALARMQELGGMRLIHPKIKIDRKKTFLFNTLGKMAAWYERSRGTRRRIERWLVFFLGLIDGLSAKEAARVCKKFVFTKSVTAITLAYTRSLRRTLKVLNASKKVLPSLVYKNCAPLSNEALLVLLAKAKKKRALRRIKAFLFTYGDAATKIRGEDLGRLGLAPGPRYGKMLKQLLYKKLDHKLSTRREELLCVKKMIGAR